MATRGWGAARSPKPKAAKAAKAASLRAGFTDQRLVSPKVHHTASSAINLPRTQRAPWQKLG